MKKHLFLAILIAIAPISAQAQLGNLLNKAAKKVGEKATEKAADAAADAVSKRLGFNRNNSKTEQDNVATYTTEMESNSESEAPASIPELIAQMPQLPTTDQLIDYKTAEIKGQTLKMMTNPVTTFRTQVFSLMAQATALAYSNLDSAAVTNMALQYSGLTAEDVKALENMNDEEQEAYIMAHYQNERTNQAIQNAALKTAQYSEMTEASVARYDAVEKEIEAIYNEANKKMAPIYAKFADRIANADDADLLNLEYYTKIADIQRNAVEQAMLLRLQKQMPIAEEIEKTNAVIRTQDSTAIIPNYLQLCSTVYFAEVERLFDIPTDF